MDNIVEAFNKALDQNLGIETEAKQTKADNLDAYLQDLSKLGLDLSKVKIASLGKGRLKVAFDSFDVAYSFYNTVDPALIDLQFDDALLAFNPPERLIKKSVNPLWVIKPIGNKAVIIERVWDK